MASENVVHHEISSTELQQKVPHLIHTNYYKNFFLLRTEIIVNGQQAQVGINEKGWLTLNSRNPNVGVTFDSLVTAVNEVLENHDLHGVSNYWCEDVPLFELKGTSQGELEKLLGLESEIREQLALKINTHMKKLLQDSDSGGTGLAPRLHVLVQAQLYLIVPDYPHLDGKPIQITKENFKECMALFGDGRLFDFGAVFRAWRTNPSREDRGPESLPNLYAELHEVVNWYGLGQALLVPDYKLLIIRQDNPHNTEMCRNAVLSWWWNNADDTKWLTLVQALSKAGSHRLARRIAIKYGVPVPQRRRASTFSSPRDKEGQISEVEMLRAMVEKLKQDIVEREKDLDRRDQSLQQVEQEKKAALQRIDTLENKISICQSKITDLMKEKDETAMALEVVNFEFDLVHQSNTQHIALQQQCIRLREKEVSNLRERLQLVENELRETNLLIPTLKEDLQMATVELEKKSTEIKVLQQNNNDMRLLLDTEKQVLDNYLLQQTAANISHDRYKQEVKMQQKYRQETSKQCVKDYKAYQEYLAEIDPEMKIFLQALNPDKIEDVPDGPLISINGSAIAEAQPGLRVQKSVSTRSRSNSPIRIKTDFGDKLSFLMWKRKSAAPQAVVRGSAAVHGLTVFVMGENSNTIHSYCMNSDEWSTLPIPCPHINPGLVFIENVLTAIGGQRNGRSTNKVTSFKPGKWLSDAIPPMKYPHSSPSVLNIGKYIVVAGGSWNSENSVVELFSLKSQNWYKVLPLPKSFYGITSTLCNNDYMVMDGAGCTYSTDLTSLLSSTSNSRHAWQEHSHLSVFGEPTLATFHKRIVCVSSEGVHQLRKYQGWVKIRYSTTSSFSPWSKSLVCVVGQDLVVDEKLVVIGGYNPNSDYATTEVSVAIG